MSFKRFSKLLLVVLALALWASAAYFVSPLTSNPASVSVTYAKGVGAGQPLATVPTLVSDANVTPDAYTVGSTPALPGWLTVTPTTGSAGQGADDTLTYAVVPAFADHMAAGTYTFNVLLQVGGELDLTVPVTLTVTAASSPLTSNPSPINLTFAKAGGAGQPAATVSATISSDDTLPDTYSIAGNPSWLTLTPGTSTAQVGVPDTLQFQVATGVAAAMAAGTYNYDVFLQVPLQPDLSVPVTLTITAVASPLTSSPPSIALTYAKAGGAGQASATVVATISSDDTLPDTYTVGSSPALPGWLTVTPGAGNAKIGTTDTLQFQTVSAVAAAMAAGVYNFTVVLQVADQPDRTVPVSLTITAGLSPLTSSPPSISLTYAKGVGAGQGAATVDATIASDDALPDTYTAAIGYPSWLTVTPGTGTAQVGVPDTLQFQVAPAVADAKAAGIYTYNVLLQVAGQPDLTVAVTLTITATASPLTSNPTSISLTYAKSLGAGQAGATVGAIISSDDTLPDTYTVGNAPPLPTWLTATPGAGNAKIGTTDTLQFQAVSAVAAVKAAGVYTFNVLLKVTGQPDLTVPVTLTITTTASPLTATPSSISLIYAKGGGAGQAAATVPAVISSENVLPDTYSVGSSPALPTWLTVTPAAGNAQVGTPDAIQFQVASSFADHYAAGTYNFNVLLKVAGQPDLTVVVTLTVTATATPLSSNPTAIFLTYVKGAGVSQGSARVDAVISSDDTLPDAYTATAGYPTWLTVTPTAGTARIATTDICRFAAASVQAEALAPNTYTFTVHLAVVNNPDLTVVVNLKVVMQPLISNVAALSLSYTKAGAVPSKTAVLTLAAGSSPTAFAVKAATVPLWLAVTGVPGTANTAPGATVTFTGVDAVLKGLATGNYSANVALAATGSSDLTIPVTLTVSNAAANLTLKEGTTRIDATYAPGTTLPVPVVTPFSSNEPVSFDAACTVTTTNTAYAGLTPCTLVNGSSNGASVTGVAYTWGTPLSTTFDNNLFNNGTPLGTVVTLTVTVTAGAQTLILRYQYTVQPLPPTMTVLSPTSAHQIAVGSSLVVTLTGTNFVSPANIIAGSPLVPTKVFVGSAYTDISANSVVVSATTIMVTIPQSNFPAFVGTATTANLAIGVANQTSSSAPTVPTATMNLVVTSKPVVYAVTSTATYLQPAPGSKPNVAPYELVSIFGANFGPAANMNGTVDAFSKFTTSVTVSGSGTSTILLKVAFKTTTGTPIVYNAPILFANATQINAIVPSALVAGTVANVVVSSGSGTAPPSSDPFPVNVVAADPGIFTISSAGVGPGAILNQDYSVNKSGNEAQVGDYLSIYMTGLGAPNSTAINAATTVGSFPAGCVVVSNTVKGTPGYLEVVNTTDKVAGYTAPATAWKDIDGAVILAARLLGTALPPCITTAASVTFGSGPTAVTTTGAGKVTYVGLVSGSVAGLYQLNVRVPAGVDIGPAVPIMVTIGTASTPAEVVTVALK